MTKKDLHNIWCLCNEDKFDYSWAKQQRKNGTLARLDFLLAFNNMLSKIKIIDIGVPCSLSDHRLLTFS